MGESEATVYYKKTNYKLTNSDYFGEDARAVINADFKEIAPTYPQKNIATKIKDSLKWIRKLFKKKT